MEPLEEKIKRHTRDLDDTRAAFFSEGYSAAYRFLGMKPSATGIVEMVLYLYVSIDELIDSFIKRALKEGKPAACRRGCSYCCSNTVFIMPHEAFYLHHLLSSQLSEDRMTEIKKKCKERTSVTKSLEKKRLLSIKHACPLLDSTGSCGLYNGRPMACRIYLSYDFISCLKDYSEDEEKSFPSLFEFPMIAGRMMHSGVAKYMEESGLIVGDGTLESMLDTVLSDINCRKEWLSGQRVFPFLNWAE